jgi:predicted MPP superfamily phosphohydrolase
MDANAKRRIKIKTILTLGLVVVVLGVGTYGFLVEPRQVEVRHVYIQDAALAKVLKDIVVVQISDLHIKKIGRREEKVLQMVEEIKPDLIFLTGDDVKWAGDYDAALEFLSRLRAKTGIWSVMGDYDYSNSRKSCLFCHEKGTGKPTKKHQVKFLRNGFEEIKLEGASFWLGGVDSENNEGEEEGEKIRLLQGVAPAIMLSHNPLVFDWLHGEREMLVLAGDTHGGQVPLPGWVWKIFGYEKNAKYSHGLYQKEKMKMYVSKGVGTSHVPIRILRPPEIVVLHFVEH